MGRNINKVLWGKKDGIDDIPFQLVGLTFEKDENKEVVDRDFIITHLKRRKITKVRSRGKDSKGNHSTVNPVEWISRVYGGKESNYIHLVFFQTVFHEYLFSDPKRMDEHFLYKNIPSKKLYKLFPNSKGQLNIIINILLAAEVLEVLEQRDDEGKKVINPKTKRPIQTYKPGEFPKSYRVHPRFMGYKVSHDSKRFELLDTRGVIDHRKWLKRRDDEERKPPPKNPWLQEVVEENILGLNIVDNAVDIYEKIKRKELVDDGTPDKNIKTFFVERVVSFGALSIRNQPSLKAWWNVEANWNEPTGRIFHTLSQYPNKVGPKNAKISMRKYLSYKKQPIMQVDVRSAHAFLLVTFYDKAIEMVDEIWGHLPPPALKGLPKRIKEEKKEYLKRFNYKNDFYATAAELGGIELESPNQTEKDYRDMVKGMFWPFLFGDAKHPNACPFTEVYDRKFPLLLKTVNYLKSVWWMDSDSPARIRIKEKLPAENRDRKRKNLPVYKLGDVKYRQMSYYLQQLEGKIMIDGVCKELGKWKQEKSKDPKSIWFVPYHDAIWVQKQSEWAVKRVMIRNWEKHLGSPPRLSTEVYE